MKQTAIKYLLKLDSVLWIILASMTFTTMMMGVGA